MSDFNNYEDYLKARCNDLGFEAATQEVRQRLGIYKEDQMPWETNEPLAQQYAEEFKKAQCPIFVEIAGEMHHVQGNHDVGVGSKPDGNNWTMPDGRKIASDIIVLKSLDGDGSFQWVDAFSSMGGPEAKPQWAVIEPNYDRSWIVPVVPGGASAPPVEGGDSTEQRLAALEEQVNFLTELAILHGTKVSLTTEEWQERPRKLVSAQLNLEKAPLLADRPEGVVGAFETFEVRKV